MPFDVVADRDAVRSACLPDRTPIAIQRRLLHAGANTTDILTQYVSAIKVLRCARLFDCVTICLATLNAFTWSNRFFFPLVV
jgi:hypothetical protein